MNHELLEENLSYDLIVIASDRICDHLYEEDWNAAIVAALVRAVEIASRRKVKAINEIYC